MGNGIKTHKDLILYQKSIRFVSDIYKITREFPTDEKFGLISQLRRASVSVPTNISEGSGRNSPKEFRHFLFVSMGSISEIETLIEISRNLKYLNETSFLSLNSDLTELRKMTASLIKSVKV